MRKSAFALLAIAPLATACGDDGGTKKIIDAAVVVDAAPPDQFVDPFQDAPIDAPPTPGDFACLSTPRPTTTTNAMVTISGTARFASLSGQGTVDGAVITAKDAGGNTVTATPSNPQTTAANGNWSFTIPTSLMPVDGHVEATCTGACNGNSALRPTFVYPPAPLVEDTPNAPTLMLSSSTWGLIQQFGGAQEAADQGSLVVVVLDCAGNPVEGATITAKQAGADVGAIRYARPFMGAPAPDPNAASTDTSGTVYVIGTPGTGGVDTTIIATQGTTSFRPRVVKSFPGTMTTMIHTP